MASKSKEARQDQKIYWESKLEERLAFLKDKGVGKEGTAKDTRIRQIRAKLRETDLRLRVIEGKEKKNEEVVHLKAERSAEKKNKKGKNKKVVQEEETVSKRQQKKQKKKEQKSKG
jgi:hypothetical protein